MHGDADRDNILPEDEIEGSVQINRQPMTRRLGFSELLSTDLSKVCLLARYIFIYIMRYRLLK